MLWSWFHSNPLPRLISLSQLFFPFVHSPPIISLFIRFTPPLSHFMASPPPCFHLPSSILSLLCLSILSFSPLSSFHPSTLILSVPSHPARRFRFHPFPPFVRLVRLPPTCHLRVHIIFFIFFFFLPKLGANVSFKKQRGVVPIPNRTASTAVWSCR